MAKSLTSNKAREILHDKSVHGHPLTDKQRRFFGAISGGAKPYKDGGWLDKYANGGDVVGPKAAPIRINGTEVFEHGEDTATADKEENGVNPTNLTKKGVEYAKSVGEEALKRGKKAVITSDIQRAKETADVIGQTANLPVYNNPVLRTWDIGEYDGAPEGSFKEKQWAAKSSTPVPGGESFDSFKARMEKAFKFADNAPKDDDIVTHSKVTRAFKALHDTGGQWTDKTTKKFLNAKDEPKKENGGWLNKYEQGGMVLEKIHDNYGKQSNYNDAKDSTGPGFVGLGYGASNWKSPAWGGQFQNGGNLWNTDKKAFVDSTLNANKNLDFVHRLYDPSLGSIQIPGEHGRSTHYMANYKTRAYPEVVNIHGKLQYLPGDKGYDYADSTGEYINFKTPEQAEWFASSIDNTSGYKMGTNVLSKIDPKTGKPKMQMGGSMPGAVGFTYARTAGSAPANGKYTKKTKASAQNGKEMSFYQNGLDFTPKTISKNGSVIEDDMGQWAHPGEVTRINSNNITMEGVDYPVLGVSDTGHQQMMYPDQHYKFDGKKVTEYPMAQDGTRLNVDLKKQAEEFLARQNTNRSTMSQYTPKAGETERLDREKQQRLAEQNAPLNRMAASKGAANMQDAMEFAALVEGGMAAGKFAGKYLTEETALKNAYKLNPYAFTPNSENYYRMIGDAGLEDLQTSGIVRNNQQSFYKDGYPFFSKGTPIDNRYSSSVMEGGTYQGPHMLEVQSNNQIGSRMAKNSHAYYAPDPNIFVARDKIGIDNPNLKIYKQDWLKGYKEVPKPTITQRVTRGPINYWEEPGFAKRNPNFNPEAYANSPVGNPNASRDIPKGMEPRYFEDNKNGGWLNKYK